MIGRRLLGAVGALIFMGSAGSASLGCASSPESIALQNKVFYQYDIVGSVDSATYEKHYQPLDYAATTSTPEFVGVSVLDSAIRMSRPRNWVMRAASLRPEERFVQYVSPNQYVVAIYELPEAPDELWRDVMDRYEESAKNVGAEIVGSRIPFATWNAQGRAYVIKRKIKAAKEPYVNFSREYLLRSSRRIVLLQVVHQGVNPGPSTAELLRFVETFQVN